MASESTEIRSFEDFWPHYVRAHRHPGSRALHYVGTSLALGCTLQGVLTLNPLWFVAAPVAGYGCAWAGHFLLEGNRPATFGHPLYSLRGDLKMLKMGLQGKMADEVERLCAGEPGAAAEAAQSGLLEPTPGPQN